MLSPVSSEACRMSKGRYRTEMCFPDINILCLCVKVLPIIRRREQRTAILLLFFLLFFYTEDCGSLPSECRNPLRRQRVSQPRICPSGLGSDAGGALLQPLLRCKRREGGQGQVCKSIPVQTGETQAEGKTSPFTGFGLGYFYF